MNLMCIIKRAGPDFEYANQQYNLRYMGNLLDASRVPHLEGQIESRPVLLIRNAEPPTAIQADSLLGSREVVVKTLWATVCWRCPGCREPPCWATAVWSLF